MNGFFIFSVAAALAHAGFFVLETVVWGTPAANAIFKVSAQEAKTLALFARNQGFYNLYLALGIAAGWVWGIPSVTVFCCGVMVGAAAALAGTAPRMWRGVLVQGLPPALALVWRFFL